MNSNQIVGQVIAKLEEAGLQYMLVGAFSSNFYGVVRSTNDADIEVVFQELGVVEFCETLGDEFVLDRQILLEGFTGSSRNVVHHSTSGFDIELFRLSRDPHHQERFARRKRVSIEELNREVWIPTGEDVVIQKLRWARRKDLDDIVNVLVVSGQQLDWDYMLGWSEQHGTTDLLRQLQAEAED